MTTKERLAQISVFNTNTTEQLETLTLAEVKESLNVVVNPKVQASKAGYLGIGVKDNQTGRTSTILFGKNTASKVAAGDSVADLVAAGLQFTVSTNAAGEERIKAFLPGTSVDTSDWS